MNKIENLAKILFLFFAVVSLGFVTVSCSDDDDDDAKTTTNTTQEEDDEDLDSIPIEDMTLEQLRKVFIGSWAGLHVDLYWDLDDTLTFNRDSSVIQTWGYFNGAKFELFENSRIKFYDIPALPSLSGRKWPYKLERTVENAYELTIYGVILPLDHEPIVDVTYRKIK